MDDFPSYLCLTDLLDLAPEVQTALRREDSSVGTLDELQARAESLRESGLME